MSKKVVGMQDIVDAINDQTRVFITVQGGFGSRAEAIRKLNDLKIPPARIAAIFTIPPKEVFSILAKAKKKAGGG